MISANRFGLGVLYGKGGAAFHLSAPRGPFSHHLGEILVSEFVSFTLYILFYSVKSH